ncbi:hypothetical protein M0811_07349 [Anaeramoeba ignava]|uniref:Uncharacterized protein n=1 Tax=Anaeramoeba ignava TaxID=1746090 RepID=A0A9Q0LN05_ANAIG|nr:hypothetical protein M0811_07349 [Anaeramoeba ignava]
MNGIVLISTLIILNIYIDLKKSISIPKLFLLSELDLIITIFWIIYSKLNFYSFQEYYLLLNLIITGLILMILISLKTIFIFNFIPWLIILIPPIIFLIYLISYIYQLIQQIAGYSKDEIVYLMFILGLIYLIIVLLFTGLKLDEFIEIKYSKLIYLLIIFEIYILYHMKKEIGTFCQFIGMLLFFVVILIILLRIFLYGDGIIQKLFRALFLIYTILFIPFLLSFAIFFSSGFKLIFN